MEFRSRFASRSFTRDWLTVSTVIHGFSHFNYAMLHHGALYTLLECIRHVFVAGFHHAGFYRPLDSCSGPLFVEISLSLSLSLFPSPFFFLSYEVRLSSLLRSFLRPSLFFLHFDGVRLLPRPTFRSFRDSALFPNLRPDSATSRVFDTFALCLFLLFVRWLLPRLQPLQPSESYLRDFLVFGTPSRALSDCFHLRRGFLTFYWDIWLFCLVFDLFNEDDELNLSHFWTLKIFRLFIGNIFRWFFFLQSWKSIFAFCNVKIIIQIFFCVRWLIFTLRDDELTLENLIYFYRQCQSQNWISQIYCYLFIIYVELTRRPQLKSWPMYLNFCHCKGTDVAFPKWNISANFLVFQPNNGIL